MKKVFLTIFVAVLGLANSANAQFNQGTITVGGGVSFSSEKTKVKDGSTTTESDPVTSYSFSPAVGYFVSDGLEVGLLLSYTKMNVPFEFDFASIDLTRKMFAAGPFVRKYFTLGESTAIFGQGSLLFGGGKLEFEDDNTTVDVADLSMFSVGVTPGFVFKPTERLGIELSAGFIGYNSETTKGTDDASDSEQKTGSFDFGVALSNVQLGVRFYLGGN